MIDEITPVILTYNEAANIRRTLNALTWAKRVIVMDSFSDDETQAICADFENVDFVQRKFDVLAWQWKAAIAQNIETSWVLALDADYVVSEALLAEIKELKPKHNIGGYITSFIYKIDGHPLKGTLYKPIVTLYRLADADYQQDGHAQRVQIVGDIEKLNGIMYHDDRKSTARWHQSQRNYARQEAEKFKGLSFTELRPIDKVRFFGLGPLFAGPYTLLVKGVIVNGWPGLKYAWQRVVAETYLLRARFQ